jgi:hypothetical protein
MYLIGNRGVKIAINREVTMESILSQLPELEDRQLVMVSDYIRELKVAEKFLAGQ